MTLRATARPRPRVTLRALARPVRSAPCDPPSLELSRPVVCTRVRARASAAAPVSRVRSSRARGRVTATGDRRIVAAMPAPRSFSEFWPFYLGEHRNPANRALHYLGTGSAYCLLAWIAWHGRWSLFPLALLVGYGPAWVGHFFIERNRPASFKYPLWSFLGDMKMLAYKLTGRMPDEMIRLFGSPFPAPDAPQRPGT